MVDKRKRRETFLAVMTMKSVVVFTDYLNDVKNSPGKIYILRELVTFRSLAPIISPD